MTTTTTNSAASILGGFGIVGGIIWAANKKKPVYQIAFFALVLGIAGMVIGNQIDNKIS